ncbi:hypothetical protein GCM10022237_04810 [Nocardioides ginsengisoli]|uniref:DinB family protein n=1 Tax=Nocardioides ginsengisoli TaxID=363868 RepID=A0ABW3VVI4_9ACTN
MTEKLYVGLALAAADETVDLAALDSAGTLVASGRAGSEEEVEAWLAGLPGSVVVIATDSPLVGPDAVIAGSRAAALALRAGWSVAPTHRGSVGWPVCVHVAADGAPACARLARIWHEEPGTLEVQPSLEQWEDGYVVAEPTVDVPASDELTNYRDYLTQYRRTLARKCAGLGPADLARRSVPPSTLSLLGLVRHMAYVEQAWFQRALQANLDEPRPFTDPDDRDFDFNQAVGTQECVDEAFAEWERQIARADAWLDAQTDATMAAEVVYNSDGETAPVRDIVVHMIEEYARHCGHADLLRECIDGTTGE